MALQLKEWELAEFIRDPVLAVYVIFGTELDTFQRAIFRMMWFIPWLVDSSGISTGKSERMFLWANLRAILLPNHPVPRSVAVYYQTIVTATDVFWAKYTRYIETAPIFREQLMRPKMRNQRLGDYSDPGCKVTMFKSGATVKLPAGDFLNDSKSQASKRFNDLGIDEVFEIDGTGSSGIDKQLIGRCTARSFNSNHPVWANHIIMQGHAYDKTTHPGYKRLATINRMVTDGSQNHRAVTSCFRDISEEFMWMFEKEVCRYQKFDLSHDQFLQIWEGIWTDGGTNWYSSVLKFAASKEARVYWGRDPRYHREGDCYVLGWDTAPGNNPRSDWSAGVVWRLRKLKEAKEPEPGSQTLWKDGALYDVRPVWAVMLRRRTAEQLSGVIHAMHQAFHFSLIVMDKGGGGSYIYEEMRKSRQLIRNTYQEVTGLCLPEEASEWVGCQPIVTYYSRGSLTFNHLWPRQFRTGDEGILDWSHQRFRTAFQNREIHWPKGRDHLPAEERAKMGVEVAAATECLQTILVQLGNIQTKLAPDKKSVLVNNRGFKRFESRSKKDGAMAAMYGFIGVLSMITKSPLQSEEEGEAW